MTTPKIIVLIIAGGDKRYQRMEEVSRDTWIRNKPEKMKVYFLKGRDIYIEKKIFGILRRIKVHLGINLLSPAVSRILAKKYSYASVNVDNDICYADVPDTWFLLSIKTIKALKYFLDHVEFDYIYRTNLGSYIQLDILEQYFQSLPRDGVYFGGKGIYERNNRFKGTVYGSGAGFGLSKDLVSRLVSDIELIISEQLENQGVLIDDVQFGNIIINNYGIKLLEVNKNNIERNNLEKGLISFGDSDFHYYFSGKKDYKCHLLLHDLLQKRKNLIVKD